MQQKMDAVRQESSRRALLAAYMLSTGIRPRCWRPKHSQQDLMRWLHAVRLLPDGDLRDAANESVAGSSSIR